MTLSTERFREQLMGYLYGELEGNELREFEDGLRASEQYRSELSSLKETLRLSREGLDVLRERDRGPPSRVSRAVLAAAAAAAAAAVEPAEVPHTQAQQPLASRPRRVDAHDAEREASSFWSFLRTPWFLPTLGVAAAVSVVVLHKQVEAPKMPEYQVPSAEHAAPGAPEPTAEPSGFGAAPPPAEPGEAPSLVAEPGSAAAEGVGAGPSDAVESKRAQVRGRARDRADEARAAPQKAATDDRPSRKGYAVPPPSWSGLAREESTHKELGEARGAGSAGAVDKAEEYEAPAARDMGSDGFGAQSEGRAAGGGAAAKPASRARSAASQAAPAPAPSAPAASVPLDDVAPGEAPASSAGSRTEPARAPDEAVKKALEHMQARRFGQAAVSYRELLQRYPKDSRAPFFRSQLTAALAALSNVDAIR